ncbi:MAG: hypothetical protein H6835_10790 [Planctomycetes bacterium]|nr:hypothetical protein [Planctomycetota bacterium]
MCNILRATIVAIALSLSATLLAQDMAIDPSPVLTGGSQVTVTYSNPSLKSQRVVIVVTGDDATTKEIEITLNEQGKGSGSTTVPATWRSAEFAAPSVPNQTLPVK